MLLLWLASYFPTVKIWHSIDSFIPVTNAVVTLGTFDGLHLGHRVITSKVKKIAQQCGGSSVVITFSPHPRMVLHPDDHNVKLLTTDAEKQKLMAAEQIDHLIVHPFTTSFSRLSSVDFVRTILVGKLKLRHLVIGYDHHFGRNREGSMADLLELAPIYGFDVEQIPEQDVNNIAVSSTKIRKSLMEGDITHANELLGYHYMISGVVVEGDKLGRTMGFPTANIQTTTTKLVPADGVYAVHVEVEGKSLAGMLYIGNRPTVHGRKRNIEVNIFDFDADVYQKEITLKLITRIRGDISFANMGELEAQLKKDKTAVLIELNNYENYIQ